MLTPEEILTIVQAHSQDLEYAAQQLLREALAKGGFDNITIVLIGFN
jgi:protein phosphatase